jgi:penicillin-binding protein 1A
MPISWPKLFKRLLKIGVALLVLGILGVVGAFWYFSRDLPKVTALAQYQPKQVTRVLDRNGAVIAEMGSEKRTFIPYAQIPKVLVNAVVAAEDADYWKHEGISYLGMARAVLANALKGRRAQGGSTITQQVIKNLLLTPERTAKRKVQEIILARDLSEKLSKEQVLELYLNHIYYGHGRYGCEEAARYFFGKSVQKIDLGEAALLAGLPQSPERLSPRKHPQAAKDRQRYVLRRMDELGLVDRPTADKLAAQPIRLSADTAPSPELAAEAVDVVTRYLRDRFGDDAAARGLTVQTSIDGKLQALAREALERGLEDLDVRQGYRGPVGRLKGKPLEQHRAALKAAREGKNPPQIYEAIVTGVEKDDAEPRLGRILLDVGEQAGVVDLAREPRYTRGGKPLVERLVPGDLVRARFASERARPVEGGGKRDAAAPLPMALEMGPQAAMVVMDPATRRILALVGGYDFRPGGFDRSQRAHRLPGSAFKPIVYAAALESGKFTGASLLNDAPDVYKNVDKLYKPGNYEKDHYRGPVRLRVALAHSINTVAIKLLEQVGIPAAKDMATRVGITSPISDDVGLPLALGASEVHPVELVNAYATFAAGGLRGQPQLVLRVGDEAIETPPPVPVLKPEVAYLTVSLMRSVVQEGTAASAASRLRRPAAGKTGTSNKQRDAWFVGFTPDLLAGVWVGFDDQRSLGQGEAGSKTALPIWIEFMSKALSGKPVRDFAPPPGVVVQRIDKATGLLPAPGQEGAASSYEEVFLEGTVPTETAPAPGEGKSADELLLGGGE